MVSFEIFVKAMPPSLSELKFLPSFCFAFKIPDNVAASNVYSLLTFWQQKRKLLVIKLFNFNIKVNKILIEIDAIIYLGLNDHIKSVAF